MAIFFTSDEHHGHLNVIKYCSRPFTDIGEMTEEMVSRHNSVVKPEDIVYHLGDFSLNKTAPGLILPRLNGKHHLIPGNHDHSHPLHAKNPEKLQRFRKMYFDAGFLSINLEDTMIIDNKQVLFSHLPYYNPNPDFDQRYPKYRPIDEGHVLLHGHVHIVWKTKVSPKGSLMINVGVDVWDFYPVALEEIEILIRDHYALKD